MLLCQLLKIYTDRKNITCKLFNTDRVLIPRLTLGDNGQDIEYIQVKKNIVADEP